MTEQLCLNSESATNRLVLLHGWGADAQDLVTVAERPWQLIPGLFVVVAVLMFNFIGDGLRDAADPYS